MPNLEKSTAKLKEYKEALSQLKGGNPIVVDGVELSPSMKDGDNDSDLSSIKRMISRLEMQVERAKSQDIRKGIEIEGADGRKMIGFARGVPSLASELGLTPEDLTKVIPTGSGGNVSRRDVRVFARAKDDGTLGEYAKRSKSRRTGDNLSIEVPKESKKGSETDSEPKELGKMNKSELVKECDRLGLEKNGTKSSILKRIRAFVKVAGEPKADETPAPEEIPTKDESLEQDSGPVNPLA